MGVYRNVFYLCLKFVERSKFIFRSTNKTNANGQVVIGMLQFMFLNGLFKLLEIRGFLWVKNFSPGLHLFFLALVLLFNYFVFKGVSASSDLKIKLEARPKFFQIISNFLAFSFIVTSLVLFSLNFFPN